MKYRKFFAWWLITFSISASLLFAQRKLDIGINLAGPVDWSASWPFVNIMKKARPFLTHNDHWVDGGVNEWNTGYIDQIPKDADGYPLKLPFHIDGAEAPQVVHTIWTNTRGLPEGTYVFLYDGDGDFSFYDDMSVISKQPGRIEVQFTRSDGQFAMSIDRSNPADHVRNIRFLMPGTESTYQQQPFEPHWVEKMQPFSTFRFMDWGYTNDESTAEITDWQQRAHPNEVTYTRVGVPYEVMIEVANYFHADAWVCIPHRASDDYIHRMARLFRDNLDPGLKVYVEYSNEWWNWMFPVSHYVLDSLDQNLEWPERFAPKLQSVLDIWTEEYAGQMQRLVRVFGGQLGWIDISNRVMQHLRPNSIDAVSPSAYIAPHPDSLTAYGASLIASDVIRLATYDLRHTARASWHEFIDLANRYNARLVYYEGGQHFTPNPFGSRQPYNHVLVAVQTDPRMYDLYTELMDSLAAFGHDPLFLHFSSISDTSGRYGSWGALTDQFATYSNYLSTAPKYQALLDYINLTTGIATTPAMPERARLLPNYPNPFNPETRIRYVLPQGGRVMLRVFDLRGREVATLVNRRQAAGDYSVTFSRRNLASGVYFARLVVDGVLRETQKMAVIR